MTALPILDVEAMNCLIFEHGFHLAFWAYYVWLSQLRRFCFILFYFFFFFSLYLGILFKSPFCFLFVDRGVGGLLVYF